MREDIIHAIDMEYAPDALIVYGSYADGTEGQDSDFDALAVGPGLPELHDTRVVCGVRLDLFVYPLERFDGEFDAGEIEQILGGRAVIDRSGIGARLLEAVAAHAAGYVPKDRREIEEALAWCDKMLVRACRGDAEGYYRWHWLLTDSLEICFDALKLRYPGPKKALRWLRDNRPDLYDRYEAALRGMDAEALRAWINGIRSL